MLGEVIAGCGLKVVEAKVQPIKAGNFGRCGKMVIAPYEIPEEEVAKLKKVFLENVRLSLCGCWEWIGRVHNGYGSMNTSGGSKWAHRVSYALFNGPIAAQRHIDHRCRNSLCVRPDHLIQVTPVENYLAIHRRMRRDALLKMVEAGQLSLLEQCAR